jgi:hypothetical protein
MTVESIFRTWQKNRILNAISSFIFSHPYLVLFLFTFIIYTINFRNIDSADTLPASLLPFALLDTHVPWLTTTSPLLQPENIVSFIPVNNAFYSAYPIVTPVLVTPLYVIPYILMMALHIPLDMSDGTCFLVVFIMEKIAASCITAAAVVIFFAGMKEIVRKNVALITTLILAFGTSMWSINSQALWQHGMIALLFSVLFYLIVRNEREEDFRISLLLGTCSALLVFTRPADMFLALPAFVYAASRKGRFFVAYCGSAIIAASPFILYNETVAGNIFGGYSSLLSEFSFGPQVLVHLFGVLISPNRGLFIFTPVALLSMLGILTIKSRIKNPELQRVFYCFGIAFILEILVYSTFNCWWAGTTYGPRFFAGSLPLIFVLAGIFLDSRKDCGKNDQGGSTTARIICLAIVSLILWSVFVQAVGVFYYPNGNWNDSPSTFTVGPFAKADTTRLWDVADTQIFRTFNAGPIVVNPIAVILNLQRTNDIIDPTTDFAIRMGTNLQDGWGRLEYRDAQPVRTVSNYSSVSVQYMRYSLGENNCTLTLVASAKDTPKNLEILVNGKPAGNYTVPASSTEFTLPISLKSSLRLGNNLIELKVPRNCNPRADTGTPAPECLDISKIKISRAA